MKQTFIENNFFEILTEEGFKDFSGVLISENRPVVEINLNNSKLKCTPEHRVKINDEFIHASSISDKIISHEDVYDLVNVQDTHSYYTNDIISHNCLILDEFAHIPNFEDFYASVLPTISAGKKTKLIFTTTPLGLNHAYKFWKDAQEGRNDFNLIFVPWNKVPGRDEEWRKKTLADMSYNYEKFDQEYACSFLGSASTLIAGWKLKELVHSTPLLQKDGFYQYKIPQDKHRYVTICDVGEGKGLDYSSIQVIDVTEMPYEQVAVFKSNTLSPYDFSSIVYRVSKLYNTAVCLIESNSLGPQVLHHLYYDLEYEHLLRTTSGVGRSGKQLTYNSKKSELGVKTSTTVKATGCSILKLIIESNQIILHDYNTIYELSRFIKKSNSYQAESGANDDLVMPLILFGWMTDQKYFKEFTDINTLNQIKEFTDEQQNDLMVSFGYVSTGHDPYDIQWNTGNSEEELDRLAGWYSVSN